MPLNRPDIEELTRAVRQWLDEEMRPALSDPAQQYRARVAANVLGIVERELQQGVSLERKEQRLLQAFLGQEGDRDTLNTLLAARIRCGELQPTQTDLLDVLHEISLAKLAIDNPRYSTFKKYQS